MSVGDPKDRNDTETSDRRQEQAPPLKPAGPSRRVMDPSLGVPELDEIISIGEAVENTSGRIMLDNQTLAIELSKLAAYGLSNNQAQNLVRIAAMRLAKTKISATNWENFVPSDRIATSELLDMQTLQIGAIVTYYVLQKESELIYVYTTDHAGNLIEQRQMSKDASREFVIQMRNYNNTWGSCR